MFSPNDPGRFDLSDMHISLDELVSVCAGFATAVRSAKRHGLICLCGCPAGCLHGAALLPRLCTWLSWKRTPSGDQCHYGIRVGLCGFTHWYWMRHGQSHEVSPINFGRLKSLLWWPHPIASRIQPYRKTGVATKTQAAFGPSM